MKIFKMIRTKAVIAATVLGTGFGAFLMPVMPVMASDGNGAVYIEVPDGWQNQARTLQIKGEDYSIYSDNGKEIPITYRKVDAAFDDDEYADVTEAMVITIDHNCKRSVRPLQRSYPESKNCAEKRAGLSRISWQRERERA